MINEQIVQLSVDELQSNPLQPRGVITPESLVDLVDSIREHGVLEPLVVAKTPAGYQIIAGERRWRAAKIAGLKEVPTVVRETSPKGMLEMAIVENVQREDLNVLDRAKAFERLMVEFGLSNSEISKRISKSAAYISNSLKLLRLPDALKDGLLTGLITEGHARALSAIADQRVMVEAYKIILRESGSVRRAEELARRLSEKAAAGRPEGGFDHPKGHYISPKTDQMRDTLEKTLTGDGTKGTRVNLTRSRSQTRIVIVLKGNIEETEDTLMKIYDGIVGNKASISQE